jgi:YidC/Oxa1 family membrane protein insertase
MGYTPPPNVPRNVFIAPADFCIRVADAAAKVCADGVHAVQGQVSGILETLQGSRLADDLITHATRVYDFLGLHLNCSANGILRPPTTTSLESLSSASRELTVSCGSGLVSALPYLVLVLAMGITTWYQQKQMQARQDPNNPQAAQMQMFAKIMPVMLMFFAFSFPTGVVLYWLTTNMWTIVQQRIILAAVPHNAAVPGVKETKAKALPEADDESPPKPATGVPNRNKKKKKR